MVLHQPPARACAPGTGPRLRTQDARRPRPSRPPRLGEGASGAALCSILCWESVADAVSVAAPFPPSLCELCHRGRRPCGKVKSRGPCGRRPAVRSLDRAGCRGAEPPPAPAPPSRRPLSPAEPSPADLPGASGTVPPPRRPERGRNQGPRRLRPRPRLRWRRRPGRARSAEWRRQGAASAPLALLGGEETRFRGRFSVFVTQAGPAGRCGRCGDSLEIPPRRKPASRTKEFRRPPVSINPVELVQKAQEQGS